MSDPVLLEIRDSPDAPPLLIVRRSADGLAGEVVISTPSVNVSIRIPEIARAFDNMTPTTEATTPDAAPSAIGPWSAVGIV